MVCSTLVLLSFPFFLGAPLCKIRYPEAGKSLRTELLDLHPTSKLKWDILGRRWRILGSVNKNEAIILFEYPHNDTV